MSDWLFSPEVISKARGYLDAGRVFADPVVPTIVWVQGSARRRYRVQTDASRETGTATYVNCTCAHGTHVGAGASKCSHAVAALLAVRDGLDLPALL